MALVVMPEKASDISQGAWLSDAKLELGRCLRESASHKDPEALYKTLVFLSKADALIDDARKLAGNFAGDMEAEIMKTRQEVYDAVVARGFLTQLQETMARQVDDLPVLKEQEKVLKSNNAKNIRVMFLKASTVKKVAYIKKLVALGQCFKETHWASGSSKLFLNKWVEVKTVMNKGTNLDFVLRTVNLMLNTLPSCPNNIASRLYTQCVA